MVYTKEQVVTYSCKFVNGVSQGKAVVNYLDTGDRYVGDFYNGNKHGKGEFTSAKQDKFVSYVGQWQNDLMHGAGQIQYQNGEKSVLTFWDKGKMVDK